MRFFSIGMIIFLSLNSLGANFLKSISTEIIDNKQVAVFEFQEPFDAQKIKAQYTEQSLNLIFPDAEMISGKNNIDTDVSGLTGIETFYDGRNTVDSKLIFKKAGGFSAITKLPKIDSVDTKIRIYLDDIFTAEQLPVSKPIVAKKAESEIPVFSKNSTSSKKPTENPMWKLMMSLALVAILSIGLIYFGKWYSKNHKRNDSGDKIRVLSNHYLGPKKQLMIVRVAGESMLLGVTDQNINLIKSLALLDEENSQDFASAFNEKLNQEDNISNQTTKLPKRQLAKNKNQSAEAEVDDFLFSRIKDKISIKLKGMRDI